MFDGLNGLATHPDNKGAASALCLSAPFQDGKAQLISRRGNPFKNFPTLCDVLGHKLKADAAIVDGEIACLDRKGAG